MASGNTGTISALNSAGFSSPPSQASPWTPSSYVECDNIGPGNSGITVTVPTSGLNATLRLYYRTDGTSTLFRVPDASIYCNESGVYGAIAPSVAASYSCNVPGGSTYVACSAFTSGSSIIAIESGPPFGLPGSVGTGGTVTANAGTGWRKSVGLIARSSTSDNALYKTGANLVGRVEADNGSSTSYYLMFFDSTTLPADGTVPLLELPVTFGITASPTINEEVFTPDYLNFATGVYFAWSSTSGTLTHITGVTGLCVRCYNG